MVIEILLCTVRYNSSNSLISWELATSKTSYVAAATQELSKVTTHLREVETDLSGTKERCEQQAHDLLRKSSEY